MMRNRIFSLRYFISLIFSNIILKLRHLKILANLKNKARKKVRTLKFFGLLFANLVRVLDGLLDFKTEYLITEGFKLFFVTKRFSVIMFILDGWRVGKKHNLRTFKQTTIF